MEFVKKHSFIFILLAYLLVNIFFMRPFWQELFFDNSKVGARYAEVFTAEWAMENVYQNILSGRSPFAQSLSVLYPFGVDFTTTDSGNGIFFVLLRPFLSTHQSLSVIVATGLFFSSLGMYFLLRKLQISALISFVIGLAFGYMTFLMVRLGHLNYFSTYVFPWFFLCGYTLLTSHNNKIKFASSFGSALFFALTLYLNLYYFIMIVIALGLLGIYGIIFLRNTLFIKVKENWKFLLITFICTILFLLPWLAVLYDTYLFEGLPKTAGWGGAIETSGDLFGFFIPASYSYFLGTISELIGLRLKFARGMFENFTYPGLIILISYFILFILKIKKKGSSQFWSSISPFLFFSFSFFLLTLGPFLHVLGKWAITLDEGIRVIIPLPYVIFHYIPFMSNIRIPARLTVAFIFFSYIICAYLLNYLFKKRSKNIKAVFFFVLTAVFFIDHYFVITVPSAKFIPYSLYQTIKHDPSKTTVYEIPSTVRDGFTYFGSGDSLEFIEGQMIHTKQVLGGYLGRISPFKRDYYMRNPFLGAIGRMTDKEISNNGIIDKNDLANWQKMDFKNSLEAIDFLDLKYIILKDDETYTKEVSAILASLGFKNIKTQEFMSLWMNDPQKSEFIEIDFSSANADIFLGVGWNDKDSGFRWAWKKASVMFKVQTPRKFNLSFTASSFYQNQFVDIYLNRKKVGRVFLTQNLTDFNLPVDETFKSGINTIHFRFAKTFRPSEVFPGNSDRRQLSAKFTKISLNEYD